MSTIPDFNRDYPHIPIAIRGMIADKTEMAHETISDGHWYRARDKCKPELKAYILMLVGPLDGNGYYIPGTRLLVASSHLNWINLYQLNKVCGGDDGDT